MKRENTTNYKRRTIKLLIVAGVLATIFITLLLLKTSVDVSEWIAKNISRTWISVASRISGALPFSLYELFLYVAIITLITLLTFAVVFLCKRLTSRGCAYLAVIAVICLSFCDVYTLTAGFSYNRTDVDVPCLNKEYLTSADEAEFFETFEFMMDDFNSLAKAMKRDENGRTISPYTHAALSDKFTEEYKRLKSDYFSEYTPRVKTILSKTIMSHMHITGVFFAPFGEANVNPLTPSSDMPVTMAHELAHSKGAMRESDANLVAYYITITSNDEYIRYSGYKACYSYMLTIAYNMDAERASAIADKIDVSVRKERIANSQFWAKYSLLDDITDWFNDIYLKLQGQKDGSDSYFEPVVPPSVVEPGTPSGGESGGAEVVYGLNVTQRMILQAIENRKNGL